MRVAWEGSYVDADPGYPIAWYDVYRQVPAGSGYELMATLPASGMTTYSYVATTTVDSAAGSNPRTWFRVGARDAAGTLEWLSLPDSGYSVDNLPPPGPTAFTATWSAGRAALSWSASDAPDLGG